ncbi:hypothetical protein D3C79_966040 [compost metagenome]
MAESAGRHPLDATLYVDIWFSRRMGVYLPGTHTDPYRIASLHLWPVYLRSGSCRRRNSGLLGRALAGIQREHGAAESLIPARRIRAAR